MALSLSVTSVDTEEQEESDDDSIDAIPSDTYLAYQDMTQTPAINIITSDDIKSDV